MTVDTQRFEDLDDLMAAMEASDAGYRYSVAWVDCTARRRGLGRSVLTRGDHAPVAALGPKERDHPLVTPRASKLGVPAPAPGHLVNPSTVRVLNDVWFRKSPRHEVGALRPLSSFFYPLDGLANWNLLYGAAGFVQYQFAVSSRRSEIVRRSVAMAAEAGLPSSLAVMKRFGPASPGPLSFPVEGWTLALDFPVGWAGLSVLLDRLDEMVALAGGRVYLAKDARCGASSLPPCTRGRVSWRPYGAESTPREFCDPISRRLGFGGTGDE